MEHHPQIMETYGHIGHRLEGYLLVVGVHEGDQDSLSRSDGRDHIRGGDDSHLNLPDIVLRFGHIKHKETGVVALLAFI